MTAHTQNPSAPTLWNPSTAANLSLLFTPILGSYLHYRNWQELGELQHAASAKKWLIAGIVVLAIAIAAAMAHSNFGGLGLIFLFAWYFASAKKQMKYVQAKYANAYTRKSLVQPILIALFCFLALFGAFAVAATVSAPDAATPEAETGVTETTGEPEIPTLAFDDFYVDFNQYAHQEVALEGLLMAAGDIGYFYKDLGSTTALMMDLTRLSREDHKAILAGCGEGCQIKLLVQAIADSAPKGAIALRIVD